MAQYHRNKWHNITEISNFHLPLLETMIQEFKEEFPELTILVGGQAFTHGGQDTLLKYTNVIYKSDMRSLELFIQNIDSNG
ncbi:hypothetical protein [Williamwhitmania taraxaci]|uniref:hypothetical protein n=1 Tax=Williamwhitmania taraxaci TaxID=1640674 RepID=UPI000B89F5A8|nr:hypothetical protein [Williamwhitmania taraxaci]